MYTTIYYVGTYISRVRIIHVEVEFFRANERLGEIEINLIDRCINKFEKRSTFSTTTPHSRYCNKQ